MATHGWRTSPSVIAWLEAEPHRFDFHQAIRHLQLLRPGSEPIAEGADPRREAIRFRSEVSHRFPSSDLLTLERAEDAAQDILTVRFLGLAGSAGPLPDAFADQIIDRIRKRDTAGRDFLDIFNHRLLSLLWRIRLRARPNLGLEPPWHSPQGRTLLSLSGLGTMGLQSRLPVPDRALPRYAGLLNNTRRSAHGLSIIVGTYFATPAQVRQLKGRWLTLDTTQQTRLGRRGANTKLGVNTVLGSRVWDQTSRCEIEIGPLSLAKFQEFLPTGEGHGRLTGLTNFYTRGEVDCDLRLTLRASEIPKTRLTTGNGGARLGWTSWLRTQPAATDDRQVCLKLSSEESA